MSTKHGFIYWGETLAVFSFFSLLLIFVTPKTGHEYDTWCWSEWAKFSFQNGFENIYKSWSDYLPFYHYILFLYGKTQGSVENITAHIYRLKMATLLFDLGSALILFNILKNKFKDRYKAIVLSLFFFMNVAVVYNSLIWGQVDGIFTFFVFASIISAYYKNLFLALLCFVLAMNTKLQAIIFLPLLLGIALPLFVQLRRKKVLISIIAVLSIQVLIILPFVWAGDFDKLWMVVVGSTGKFPVVSMNAYNMWYFFLEGNLIQIPDSIKFGGISYLNWGLILFFISSFFALFHLIKPNYQFFIQKKDFNISFQKVLISATLIPLLFFFFNTQMHERYSHPAFIFLVAYSTIFKKYFAVIVGSIAYFLNLENVLRYLDAENYHTLIFTPWFIACLYLLTILFLFFDLYEAGVKSQNIFSGYFKNYKRFPIQLKKDG